MLRRGALSFLTLTALGCASLGVRDAQCPGGKAVSNRPDRLIAQADEEYQEGNEDGAYRCLALVQERHPDSEERDEAFRLASWVYRRLYLRNRYTDPDADWFGTERQFMFEWLDSYASEGFPQEQAEQLLRGMPYDFFQSFRDYAAGSENLSRWEISVADDNGRIESVSARARD